MILLNKKSNYCEIWQNLAIGRNISKIYKNYIFNSTDFTSSIFHHYHSQLKKYPPYIRRDP